MSSGPSRSTVAVGSFNAEPQPEEIVDENFPVSVSVISVKFLSQWPWCFLHRKVGWIDEAHLMHNSTWSLKELSAFFGLFVCFALIFYVMSLGTKVFQTSLLTLMNISIFTATCDPKCTWQDFRGQVVAREACWKHQQNPCQVRWNSMWPQDIY